MGRRLFMSLITLLTLTQATYGQVNLSGVAPCAPSQFWITGVESDTHDDAKSTAACPDGYYASECVCQDTKMCDGTEFASDGRTCTSSRKSSAYGQSNRGTKVMVRCQSSAGLNVKVVRVTGDKADRIYCPEGYVMDSCVINDLWSEGQELFLVRTFTDQESIQCNWNHPKRSVIGKPYIMSAVCVMTNV